MNAESANSVNIKEWLDSIYGVPAHKDLQNSPRPHAGVVQTRKRAMNPESEETPVPAKRHRIETPMSPITFAIDKRSTASSVDSRSSISSKRNQSRSVSPIKRKRDLEFVKPDIIYYPLEELEAQRSELEKTVPRLKSLLSRIEEAQRGLPKGLEELIRSSQSLLRREPLPPFIENLEAFSDLQPYLMNTVQEATFCSSREATEEEWSDRIVYPTLLEAAKRVQDQKKVDIINVKAIDITPSELLPEALLGVTQKKRVDYALGYPLPDLNKVRSIVAHLKGRSLNQSDHTRLCYDVLFSHLEIKRKSNRDGEIQLGVWCAAGFKRLETLRRVDYGGQPPAPIPLWLWEDDILILYVAIQAVPDTITIYEIMTWSCRRVQSLLELVIVLAGVMTWGMEEYVPWFTDYIGYDNV